MEARGGPCHAAQASQGSSTTLLVGKAIEVACKYVVGGVKQDRSPLSTALRQARGKNKK